MVLVAPIPEVRVASKAVLIRGRIPMTKPPATTRTPLPEVTEEIGAQETSEAAVVTAEVVVVAQVGRVVSGLIEVVGEAAVVVVSPAKTPLIMLATGEMIFPKLMIGTMRSTLAHWPTLRYLRHPETVAQVPRENRGRRPIDLINSLSNLCQQQVCV